MLDFVHLFMRPPLSKNQIVNYYNVNDYDRPARIVVEGLFDQKIPNVFSLSVWKDELFLQNISRWQTHQKKIKQDDLSNV
jgi:hypothetical protein